MSRLRAALVLPSILAISAYAQQGMWRAVSTTARAITGDIVISGERLTVNFLAFPIAEIRALKPEEAQAVFNLDAAGTPTGKLYRMNVPAATRLLHKNTLCGSDDTTWMVAYQHGRDLQVAMFSGATPPVFTAEAMADTTNLCGTYSYTR